MVTAAMTTIASMAAGTSQPISTSLRMRSYCAVFSALRVANTAEGLVFVKPNPAPELIIHAPGRPAARQHAPCSLKLRRVAEIGKSAENKPSS